MPRLVRGGWRAGLSFKVHLGGVAGRIHLHIHNTSTQTEKRKPEDCWQSHRVLILKRAKRSEASILRRALLLALLLLVLPLSNLASGDDPIKLAVIVLRDGDTLDKDLEASYFEVPAGVTAYYSRDIVIRAQEIHVKGFLMGLRSSGKDAPNLTLDAGLVLRVDGSVRGASGASMFSLTTNESATGPRGGQGGSLRLILQGPGAIVLGTYALVESGRGGSGGSVTGIGGENTSRLMVVQGGDGGNGGDLGIMSQALESAGRLVVGAGGNGGNADARHWGRPQAFGGDAGRPGLLALPPVVSAQTLITLGVLGGGQGANGGLATGIVVCPGSCPGTGLYNESITDDGEPGSDASAPGGTGGAGQKGSPARAVAGDGSPRCALVQVSSPWICFGIHGGNGGTAKAWAGKGGRGGAGGAGTSDGGEGIVGGSGGFGGPGGDATAEAGARGCGVSTCGAPGEAFAISEGGEGGPGGDGGGSTFAYDSPASCSTASGSACWVPADTVCGHAGSGGWAGFAGATAATSPGGSDYEHPDARPGLRGVTGGYPLASCAHSVDHAHYP